MALSIIDSVARARRGQQAGELPPEGEDEEAWRARPGSVPDEEDPAAKEEPNKALGELLGLEKLMGPGYLEKLMGPGVAGATPDEADATEELAVAPPSKADQRRRTSLGGEDRVGRGHAPDPTTSDEQRRRSLGRDRRRAIARARRTADQERRRSEAGRRTPRVDPREDDRRRSIPEKADSHPAPLAREPAPARDSALRQRPRLEPAATAAAPGERDPRPASRSRGNHVYRELFGDGGRDSLRRAFVLKEILDAPAAERPPDRREAR